MRRRGAARDGRHGPTAAIRSVGAPVKGHEAMRRGRSSMPEDRHFRLAVIGVALAADRTHAHVRSFDDIIFVVSGIGIGRGVAAIR